MRCSRCRLVAVRDPLTARGLQRHGIHALSPGNPMMDDLEGEEVPDALKKSRRLIVLCGSRRVEAKVNFHRLLWVIENIQFKNSMVIFAPLGSQPSTFELEKVLKRFGYKPLDKEADLKDSESCWGKQSKCIYLGKGQFAKWANWAEVGLATAGTATEQLVGLGVPALSLPGPGPQFTKGFAFRQSRLLGGSVIPCKNKNQMIRKVEVLFKDEQLRKDLGLIGISRMGVSGGSVALAELIANRLLDVVENLSRR